MTADLRRNFKFSNENLILFPEIIISINAIALSWARKLSFNENYNKSILKII